MVIPSGGNRAKLSSGSAYCVAGPYVGLFHQWGTSCGFRGIGWWNFWRDASTYSGMETSTAMLVQSQLIFNSKNKFPLNPLWWHINLQLHWKGALHPACWWTWFQNIPPLVWTWYFLTHISIALLCAGLVHICIFFKWVHKQSLAVLPACLSTGMPFWIEIYIHPSCCIYYKIILVYDIMWDDCQLYSHVLTVSHWSTIVEAI